MSAGFHEINKIAKSFENMLIRGLFGENYATGCFKETYQV